MTPPPAATQKLFTPGASDTHMLLQCPHLHHVRRIALVRSWRIRPGEVAGRRVAEGVVAQQLMLDCNRCHGSEQRF